MVEVVEVVSRPSKNLRKMSKVKVTIDVLWLTCQNPSKCPVVVEEVLVRLVVMVQVLVSLCPTCPLPSRQ